jgi:hypothetical protein
MYILGWWGAGFLLAWLFRTVCKEAASAGWTIAYSVETKIGLKLTFLGLTGICLILLAAASDEAALYDVVLRAEMTVLGARFEALAIGFIFGLICSRYKETIRRKLNLLYDALLGKGENSAWALQVAIAILSILAIAMIAKPDLLDHIQSLKAGEVEATFAKTAETSSSVMQANVALADVNREVTLDQWNGFEEFYIRKDSARALASQWFSPSEVSEERTVILTNIFYNHISPIVSALICLKKFEGIEIIRRDKDIMRLGSRWKNFLLSLREHNSEEDIRNFLDDSTGRISLILNDVHLINAECAPSSFDSSKRKEKNAEVAAQFELAKKKLKENVPALYAVTIFDAYIVGAVSDLLAFCFGHQEKAIFLSLVSQDVPRMDKIIQPGIINLFYQLTDSKIKSDEAWPLDNVDSDLTFALRGVEYLIAKAKLKAEISPANSAKDRENAYEIISAYSRNQYLLYTRTLEIYNHRVLSGEHISDMHRQKWAQAYASLAAVMAARLDKPQLVKVESIPSHALDLNTQARSPSVPIEPEAEYDAAVAASLSAVLLHSADRKAPSTACVTAQYYLNAARKKIPIRSETSATDRERWNQFLQLVEERIRAPC